MVPVGWLLNLMTCFLDDFFKCPVNEKHKQPDSKCTRWTCLTLTLVHIVIFYRNNLILIEFVFHRVESMMRKGEDAVYQHFFLFSHCFWNPSSWGLLKLWTVGVKFLYWLQLSEICSLKYIIQYFHTDLFLKFQLLHLIGWDALYKPIIGQVLVEFNPFPNDKV